MEQLKMAKQMIEFQKATFDNSFNAMVMLQEQTERTMNSFLEQSGSLPEEGKKLINEWVRTFKNGREEFKKAVDESFKRIEEYFAATSKKG